MPDIALFRSVTRELGSEEAAGLELCQRMWRFHTQELGWSDIAQHVTIDPAGRIWLNRSWDRPPASAKGFNGSSKLGPFMIEVIGNFDQGIERPTECTVAGGSDRDRVHPEGVRAAPRGGRVP